MLDAVTMRIDEGEHVAILGPNGCGKSTLIKALTRELYPFAGKGAVRVCGRDRWVIAELRTLLGVVSEEPREPLLGDPTGLEMAVSGLIGTYGVVAQHDVTTPMWRLAADTLDRVEASHLEHRTVDTMSTGERRRVFIARALISRPKALLLDEPTTGLDMKAAFEFHALIRSLANSGTTIILVTHHLEEIVPEIGRVIMLKRGKVLADGLRNELLTADRVCELFAIDEPTLKREIQTKLAVWQPASPRSTI